MKQPEHTGEVTYNEVRKWIVWLDVFTPEDLCDAMRCDLSLGPKFVQAALWHGIIEDTGEELVNGHGYPERVYAYIHPPPGPTHHFTQVPPERLVGYTDVLSPRGLPIRLMDHGKKGTIMQTPGGRRRMKAKESAWERQLRVDFRDQKRQEKKEKARDRVLAEIRRHQEKKRREKEEYIQLLKEAGLWKDKRPKRRRRTILPRKQRRHRSRADFEGYG
jgi:hypothetical protein